MKKKESTFWNMLWSLTLITAVAGGLLGYTYQLTEEPIARATKASREKAIQQVILAHRRATDLHRTQRIRRNDRYHLSRQEGR